MDVSWTSVATKPLTLIVTAATLGGIGQFFIRWGVGKVGELNSPLHALKVIFTPLVLIGFIAYGISSLLYLMVLSKKGYGLSYAYPFVAGNQVIVALLAWLAFHEAISPMRGLGIAVVCIGVTLIAMGQ